MSYKKNQCPYISMSMLLALAFLFCPFFFVHAQTTPAVNGQLLLTTSPLPIDLNVSPGSTVSAPIKIKNDGDQPENLKVTLMKFKADPTTGATILSDRQPGDNYFDWVTFSDPTFTLQSNEWKTITATFNVPKTASFDYYYAIVFFRANQQVAPGTRQTVMNGGTATLVLLTADVPNAKKELTLDSFTVNKNIFEFLPANFNIKLTNTGNVHVIPHGNIFITKDGQNNIATLDVNDTQGSILPDSPRTFATAWVDGFPVYVPKLDNGTAMQDAKGNPIQELKWNFADASKLRWGKYTAHLFLVYDNGTRDVPIEGIVSFWVVPWRLVLYFILVILVPALAVYIFMKWRMKKLKKQYSNR